MAASALTRPLQFGYLTSLIGSQSVGIAPVVSTFVPSSAVVGTEIPRDVMIGVSSSFAMTMGSIPYPGNDPTVSPGEGFEWRGRGEPGSGRGSWHNPNTGVSLHPDLNHPPPIGPHWDHQDADGNRSRVMPDGTIVPKHPGKKKK